VPNAKVQVRYPKNPNKPVRHDRFFVATGHAREVASVTGKLYKSNGDFVTDGRTVIQPGQDAHDQRLWAIAFKNVNSLAADRYVVRVWGRTAAGGELDPVESHPFPLRQHETKAVSAWSPDDDEEVCDSFVAYGETDGAAVSGTMTPTTGHPQGPNPGVVEDGNWYVSFGGLEPTGSGAGSYELSVTGVPPPATVRNLTVVACPIINGTPEIAKK
jgi:hypothetical protein